MREDTPARPAHATNRDIWERLYRQGNYMRYPVEQLVRLYHRHGHGHLPPGALVVDYGAGSGNNAEFFVREGHRVVALDISETALKVLRERFRVLHLPAPETRLVQPDGDVADVLPACDAVVLWDVLYYNDAETARRMLRACIDALRPGGMLFVNMVTPRHHFIADADPVGEQTYAFRGEAQAGAIMCTPGTLQELEAWCKGLETVALGGYGHYDMNRRADFFCYVGRKS